MILHGLLQTGDHVITTSVEHNAVMRPLYLLEQEGVEVSYLACDTAGELTSEKIESALQKKYKIASYDACFKCTSFCFTGRKMF